MVRYGIVVGCCLGECVLLCHNVVRCCVVKCNVVSWADFLCRLSLIHKKIVEGRMVNKGQVSFKCLTWERDEARNCDVVQLWHSGVGVGVALGSPAFKNLNDIVSSFTRAAGAAQRVFSLAGPTPLRRGLFKGGGAGLGSDQPPPPPAPQRVCKR